MPLDTATAPRDQLVLAHLQWARAIATRVHETLPPWVDVEDIFHAGLLGLFEAAERYDEQASTLFPSYAKHRIKGAIFDSLRREDWVPRRVRRWQRLADRAARHLSTTLNRQPTQQEILATLGPDFERSRATAADLDTAALIVTTAQPREEPLAPAELAPSREPLPDTVVARKQVFRLLRAAFATLPPRLRRVIELYYGRDWTMKEIGAALGVNESRVSQLHKAALARLARSLHSAGVSSSAPL